MFWLTISDMGLKIVIWLPIIVGIFKTFALFSPKYLSNFTQIISQYTSGEIPRLFLSYIKLNSPWKSPDEL